MIVCGLAWSAAETPSSGKDGTPDVATSQAARVFGSYLHLEADRHGMEGRCARWTGMTGGFPENCYVGELQVFSFCKREMISRERLQVTARICATLGSPESPGLLWRHENA
jgi:hypothetical protein